jgi:hypothetical protein
VETLLTLVPEAAGHELLGGSSAFQAGTATGAGLTTTVVCDDLADPSGAQTYKGWRIYFHTSSGGTSIAGQERLVTGVDLATGTFTLNKALPRTTATGDGFWLLQTYRRSDWLGFANRALRQMKRRAWTAVQGLGDSVLRYETAQLPAGLVRPEDVIDVGTRSYPAVNTEGKPTLMRWFGWEDNDGTFSLLLSDGVSTARALVLYMEKPYALPSAAALTADADQTTAPLDWLVGEMVERALRDRWARAVGDDKRDWLMRLQAQIVTNRGFKAKYLPTAGRRNMGFDPTF